MVILRAICGIAVKVARFDMPTCKLINELDDLEFEAIKFLAVPPMAPNACTPYDLVFRLAGRGNA
jgi:hypothetical protein